MMSTSIPENPSCFVHGADAPRLGEAVGRGHEGAQVAARPLEVPLEVHLEGEGVGHDLVVAPGSGTAPMDVRNGRRGPGS